jgi:hypothetical protein
MIPQIDLRILAIFERDNYEKIHGKSNLINQRK